MFDWCNSFSVGIQEIDDQHKNLFKLGGLIFELLHENSIRDKHDDIVSAIDELIEYTIYHFETEEKLLDKYGYPEIITHKEEHASFVSYLNSLDLSQIDENQYAFAKQILIFISKWIFQHISDVDFQYSKFLEEKIKADS